MRKTLLAVAFCASFTGSAFAQSNPQVSSGSRSTVNAAGQHTVTYKDRTEYDFDAEEVTGSVVQPDVDMVTGRIKAHHKSLVQPRGTFQPELLQSVEKL